MKQNTATQMTGYILVFHLALSIGGKLKNMGSTKNLSKAKGGK